MAGTKAIPAVNSAIFNDKKEILLTRRSQLIRAPGQWVMPGGHVDYGETWEMAAKREVKEEVGLTVVKQELLGIYSDPRLTVSSEVLYDGCHGHFVVAVFLVTQFEGEVIPNDEVDLWGWYKEGDLPGPLLRSHPVRIQDAFHFQKKVFVR